MCPASTYLQQSRANCFAAFSLTPWTSAQTSVTKQMASDALSWHVMHDKHQCDTNCACDNTPLACPQIMQSNFQLHQAHTLSKTTAWSHLLDSCQSHVLKKWHWRHQKKIKKNPEGLSYNFVYIIYIYLPSVLRSNKHSQKGISLSGLFTVSFREVRRDKRPQGTVPQWQILQPPLCPVLGISLPSTVPPPTPTPPPGSLKGRALRAPPLPSLKPGAVSAWHTLHCSLPGSRKGCCSLGLALHHPMAACCEKLGKLQLFRLWKERAVLAGGHFICWVPSWAASWLPDSSLSRTFCFSFSDWSTKASATAL